MARPIFFRCMNSFYNMNYVRSIEVDPKAKIAVVNFVDGKDDLRASGHLEEIKINQSLESFMKTHPRSCYEDIIEALKLVTPAQMKK